MEYLPFKGSGVLVSAHPGVIQIFEEIHVLASSKIPVLFTGETGTGKDLFARSIHYLSDRSNKPFMAINCGAIPKDLIESELFGCTKGAFTGANDNRKGYFEKADGGTLFLDEIGELPLEFQVKLLRVLQQGEFSKVGSTATISVDVRIVAATNRDLEKMVKQGYFRKDLYYRIAQSPFQLLPLRKRKVDIAILAKEFLRIYSARAGKRITSISPQTLTLFRKYNWPGNIRELEDTIEMAITFYKDSPYQTLNHRNFPSTLKRKFGLRKSVRTTPRPNPGQVEREILNVLAQGGSQNIRSLTKATGRSSSTIKDNLRKLERAGRITIDHCKGRSGNMITLNQTRNLINDSDF